MNQNGFPSDLLKKPPADRIAYFNDYTMAHPILADVIQKLMSCIQESADNSLIFIFGPTGVGKSTLLRRVSQKLIKASLSGLKSNKGRIPIAGIEAVAPEFSNFDWKDFYWRAFNALEDPFGDTRCLSPGHSKLKMRVALESALRNRQPDIFYVDEAQNLGKVSSGRKLRDQADCIKSLANLSSVQFVLVGTYELLMLRNLSAQLCRRSIDIHFPRYQAELPQDLKVFRSIVHTFQQNLPLADESDLVEHWEFLYERSMGCVGILKNWLSRTLTNNLKEDKTCQKIQLKDLEKYAPPLEKCLVMVAEIREEERQLDNKVNSSDLRAALGLKAISADQPEQTPTKKTRRAVGKPAPQRRPVGGGQGAK
ncbi:MAG TPA: ATP-binding protein [Trichocoleus sp.]